jgi:hypothetical protein
MADIFDKAETGKDCVQTGKNCEGHKWLKKFAAAKKCKQEGNCDEIKEAAAKTKDKLKGIGDKIVTLDKCNRSLNDPEEMKKCYEIGKKIYRDKQAKKEEARQALEVLANQRKSLGDSVCLTGRIGLGLVKVKVKGFVEQVSGDRIQIRIADTQGQAVSYQGASLWQNTILWDSYGNWIDCSYLKGKR